MNPNVWGNHAWIFLHMITFNYPENPTPQDKKNMHSFFMNLSNVLPCSSCSLNLKKHMLLKPLDDNSLSSKENLIKWLFDIHNMVNASINKNKCTWNQFIKNYDKLNKKNNKKIIYILLIIITIVVSFFILIIYNIKNKKIDDRNFVRNLFMMNNQ